MHVKNLSAVSPGVSAESRCVGKCVRGCLRTSNEGGQSLLELALSLPLLLLVVTGLISFGFVFNNYLELTNATSESAQALAISRGQTSDPCNTTVQAFYSAAPFLTQKNLTFTIALGGTNVGGTSCPSATLVENQTAQVTVTYPCNFFLVYGLNLSCTLRGQTAEAIQ